MRRLERNEKRAIVATNRKRGANHFGRYADPSGIHRAKRVGTDHRDYHKGLRRPRAPSLCLTSTAPALHQWRPPAMITAEPDHSGLSGKCRAGRLVGAPLRVHRMAPPGVRPRQPGRHGNQTAGAGTAKHEFSMPAGTPAPSEPASPRSRVE
jgi:hypothetical protein